MFFLTVLISDHLSYSLPTDVMATVFKAGAKTEGGWSFLLSKYVSLGSEAEKNKILEALASSEDVRKLYWYEATRGIWSMETESIRAQSPLGGGDPPFPPFAHRPGLTRAGWWGDPTCRGSSQGPDLSPQATMLCPEGTGDAKSHSPARCGIKNVFLPLAHCL